MLWSDVIMLNDLIVLHFSCIDSLCLFDVVMLFKRAIETLNFMLSHRERVTRNLWDVLNKTNHSRCAFWVKFIIISGFHSSEFSNSFVRGILEWVFWDFRFDIVSEVSNKSHSIIELNIECLIIDGSPVTFNSLLTTLSSILAYNSLHLIIIHNVHSVSVKLIEAKLMVLV